MIAYVQKNHLIPDPLVKCDNCGCESCLAVEAREYVHWGRGMASGFQFDPEEEGAEWVDAGRVYEEGREQERPVNVEVVRLGKREEMERTRSSGREEEGEGEVMEQMVVSVHREAV